MVKKKVDLAKLKTDIDKLQNDKLETAPVDLNMLSNVKEMKLLKSVCMMNWLKKLMPLILLDLF